MLFLDESVARFHPKWLYWFFIPCDMISLIFQAVGGALSSTSSGANDTGTDISLFGLTFQVFTLGIFLIIVTDYLVRFRLRSAARGKTTGRFKIFLTFLLAATALILTRCGYRIGELRDGYFGELIHNENLFYGLESVYVPWALCPSEYLSERDELPTSLPLYADSSSNNTAWSPSPSSALTSPSRASDTCG